MSPWTGTRPNTIGEAKKLASTIAPMMIVAARCVSMRVEACAASASETLHLPSNRTPSDGVAGLGDCGCRSPVAFAMDTLLLIGGRGCSSLYFVVINELGCSVKWLQPVKFSTPSQTRRVGCAPRLPLATVIARPASSRVGITRWRYKTKAELTP